MMPLKKKRRIQIIVMAAVALLGFFSINFPSQSASGRHLLSAVHACFAVMLFVLAPIATAIRNGSTFRPVLRAWPAAIGT